ncbi:hypothetical protein [Thiohalophilus sp.]|uniref:hypothetical protein n=1 Tax=Thiohalophilus sp. TaxID=3028392 RepID=UPI003976B31B
MRKLHRNLVRHWILSLEGFDLGALNTLIPGESQYPDIPPVSPAGNAGINHQVWQGNDIIPEKPPQEEMPGLDYCNLLNMRYFYWNKGCQRPWMSHLMSENTALRRELLCLRAGSWECKTLLMRAKPSAQPGTSSSSMPTKMVPIRKTISLPPRAYPDLTIIEVTKVPGFDNRFQVKVQNIGNTTASGAVLSGEDTTGQGTAAPRPS